MRTAWSLRCSEPACSTMGCSFEWRDTIAPWMKEWAADASVVGSFSVESLPFLLFLVRVLSVAAFILSVMCIDCL